MCIFKKLGDNGPSGCNSVVGAPRKLMWTSWLIQHGQSLSDKFHIGG
jgi:hypothetical protein